MNLFQKVAVIFLVFTLLMEIRNWILGNASRAWKTTEGKLLEAYVDTEEDFDDDEQHSPKVKYTYSVNGKRYTSKNFSYGTYLFYDYFRASDSLFGFVKNQTVDVYYGPKKPSRSVLRPGSASVSKLMMVLYVVFIILFIKLSSE